jgi:hypothetical protein
MDASLPRLVSLRLLQGAIGRPRVWWFGITPALIKMGETRMLWTIFVLLLILWMLGLVTSYTLGGFIHILLIVAIAVLCIQLISGRRVV